jgi:hypothetical protein
MKTSTRTIFRPAPRDPFIRNAVVNFDPSHSPGLVATGYRLAARRLVDSALADGGDQDFLIGPIAFLYRQSVELALKHVIALDAALAGTGRATPHGHNLRVLWRAARTVILQVDPGTEPGCALVDPVINELAATDPKSDAFRYPVRRDGTPSWPADLSLIDLQQLGEVMDDLCERLEAAGDMLGVAVDTQQEWIAYQREMAEEYRED